jgi:hypothetical protein
LRSLSKSNHDRSIDGCFHDRCRVELGSNKASGRIVEETSMLEPGEHLFDAATGYPKEEIQNEFEVVDLDLFIIDYVAIHPKFRGLRIAESAIHRTIDIFGTGCGLVACKPWPLQFTPSVADDQEALNRLTLPNVSKGEAIRKLRSYWSRLGFWPLGNSGIHLLSLSQRGCDVSSLNRVKGPSVTLMSVEDPSG